MDQHQFPPGYVASLLSCQRTLVEALNTATNRLGELGDAAAAIDARSGRDSALALVNALRFGARLNVIAFRDGEWWWVDMTFALRGPITRKEAYMTAVSYMDAREVAAYDAKEACDELRAEYRRARGSSLKQISPTPKKEQA